MSEVQERMIKIWEELLESLTSDTNPENIKRVNELLNSLQLPDVEILKIRLDYLKQAQKEGMLAYDWLRKQCRIMLSDPSYMKLISKKDRNSLLSYNSRLTNGQWCDDKDDLMFSRLRKQYQEFSSKKTSVYTS